MTKVIRLFTLVCFLATGVFAFTPYTKPSKKAFTKSYSNLNYEEEDTFMLGRSFFTIPWVEAPSATTARDGLGPLFNANTCVSCHPNNALGSVYSKNGSISRSMVVRLSIPSNNSDLHKKILSKIGFIPEPTYGAQLSLNGLSNVSYEGKLNIEYSKKSVTYADGKTLELRVPSYSLKNLNYGELFPNTNITVRKAPALVGLGLLEEVLDEEILKNEDIEDKNNDGISGVANIVFSIKTNSYKVGRYTYKASAPTVKHQNAAAFHNDMGLTTTYFPTDNCTKKQTSCLNAPKARDYIDVPDFRLEAIDFYLRHLKVPKTKIETSYIKEGKKIFNDISCSKCHLNSLKTKTGLIIRPYSDFLLHDMGELLGDGRREFKASKNEWRTAPLWGINSYEKAIGKRVDFLHDGRARSIEEAILWHAGEALSSKNSFMNLDETKRTKVIKFIRSL